MTSVSTYTKTIEIRQQLTGKSAQDILSAAVTAFPGKITFASSLGAEDQVITDIIYRLGLDIPIFTLDTGRLYSESYELIAASEKKYGIKIKSRFPDRQAVEDMVAESGINLFLEGIEQRKRCCRVRKLEPLKRVLADYEAWICGLRREQSVTREDISEVDWDGTHRMPKFNPLVNWTEADVWNYIKTHDVPYNKLHDQGFASIGCACCTRAIKPGEDVRAGRWWWESPEQKECGLHVVNGKLVKKNCTIKLSYKG
jgi:phosphoadenosine phosphosulfate reductase